MIPSYQEELRIRKNKDRIFWLIVGIMTIFLYLFFQGYYPNYERFLSGNNSSKQAFLKPFGIIDIHVFPSPDDILINNERYNNNSKTIFDLGEYMVSIQKKGYLPIVFPLDISKRNPFYTNVVNLFAFPEYSELPVVFDSLSAHNDFFLLGKNGTGSYLLVDTDFKILHSIQTEYQFIGGLYFHDGGVVYNYSPDTEKFLNVIDRETSLPLRCNNISYYGEKLFCHDTMKFVGPRASDIREKILAINNKVVITSKYLYNQDVTNTSWKYFEYQTGSLKLPETIVHINKIPYLFEKGILSPIDKTSLVSLKKQDWGMDTISHVQQFDSEAILLGEKAGHGMFRIIEAEKQYSGIFDFDRANNVRVFKLNGAYIFINPKSAYIYYKGAKEIVKILDSVDIIKMIDSKIFFNKNGKSYTIDLLRKAIN